VFCCVGALAIVDALEHVDQDLLGWWLAERQLPNGGLNGRPEKLEDVCYSWWCLSALSILNRLHWIDRDKLIGFILSCQVRGARARRGVRGRAGRSSLTRAAGAPIARRRRTRRPAGSRTGPATTWTCSTPTLAFVVWQRRGRAARRREAPCALTNGGAHGGCSPVRAAGLSLLGYEGLRPVNPVYCMQQDVIDRCGLGQYRLLA